MHDTQSGEQTQRCAHLKEEILEQIDVGADAVIEVTVVYHIDSLALVKLTSHIEEMFIHCSPFTELIDQPQILLVFHRVLHHANRFLILTDITVNNS